MKKFRLIALAIVCILSTACFFACKGGGDSTSTSVPEDGAHVCQFGEWEVVSEATCTAEGSQQRVCIAEGCDKGVDGAPAVETEAIEMLEHAYGDWHYDETSGTTTCVFAANDIRVCEDCGKVDTRFQEFAAHSFVNGVCSVCGYDPANSKTYKTYTSVSPSNWNELTYQDNNDTQIMSYIGSPFFESDFKFAGDGSAKEENIVPGSFTVKYSFATNVEDVTAAMAEKWGYSEEEVAAGGFAWKITIRPDGRWQNGDPIVAGDFVYSMQEQLNPLFFNYRADSFYNGSVNIKNAKNYLFQGKTIMSDNFNAASESFNAISSIADLTKGEDGVYNYNGKTVKFAIKAASNWCGGKTLWNYGGYLDYDSIVALGAMCDENGYVDITDETIALLSTAITTADWGEDASNVPCYILYESSYPEMAFSEVGIFAASDTELVICLEDAIHLKDENDNLTYHCFYEFSSLPLVHKATYEACKVAPEAGVEGALWTSKYNSSLETTMSWGPYKLTQFQAGKFYKLERNTYWYGYTADLYPGQYETTAIECETITSYNTAFLKFLDGDLTGIGIDVSKADEYKGSSQAYFTPDDFVGSMQLQSNKEALKEREIEGINKTLLSYEDFRKAISLSFNREEYNKTCTTSSKPGFGLFNSMHYYDVANGGAYRETDTAKKVLCEVYGIDVEDYDSLDDAYDAITGYDMVQARALLEKAYAEALANGDIKAGDTVLLTVGTATDTESTRRVFNFIKASLENLAVGTSLEGRLTAEFNTSFGTKWANDFRAGAYDICTGGWTGAAWDPGYFLMAYLSDQYMYSSAWDTSAEMVTITVHGVKEEKSGYVVTNDANDSFTAELPAFTTEKTGNWYGLLNNQFGDGNLNNEFRLEIIAALEKLVLTQYYSVPISYSFGASLISYQVDYLTYEYNTFNGYGGIQYMTYHYNDAEWAEYLKSNTLDYTK